MADEAGASQSPSTEEVTKTETGTGKSPLHCPFIELDLK